MISHCWALALTSVVSCISSATLVFAEPLKLPVYVANRASQTLSIVDGQTNQVVDAVDLAALGSPLAVLLSKDARRAYIGLSTARFCVDGGVDRLLVLDTNSLASVGVINIDPGPIALAVSPDNDTLYVVSFCAGAVSLVDTATLTVRTRIVIQSDSGVIPTDIAVARDGSFAYLSAFSGQFGGLVARLDPNAGAVTAEIDDAATIAVQFAPSGPVAFGARNLFFEGGGHNFINMIDTDASEISATSGLLDTVLEDLAVSHDGRLLYVAGRNGTLLVIDASTLSLIKTIAVGALPIDLALSEGGDFLYVANNVGNSLSVVDTNENEVVATIPVGLEPVSVSAAERDSSDGGGCALGPSPDADSLIAKSSLMWLSMLLLACWASHSRRAIENSNLRRQ